MKPCMKEWSPISKIEKTVGKGENASYQHFLSYHNDLKSLVIEGFSKLFKARKHMCFTDCHDMTLAVIVALNPNTTNQNVLACVGLRRSSRLTWPIPFPDA